MMTNKCSAKNYEDSINIMMRDKKFQSAIRSMTIENLKQENIALSNQLKKIKKEVQATNIDNEKLVALIIEIEDLRSQFIKTIKDLNTAKNRYNALNKELMEVKQSLQVIYIPLYHRLSMKIKKK